MVRRATYVFVSLIALFAALTPGTVSTLAAGPLLACPPLLPVTQAAKDSPKEWTPIPYSGAQRLSRITFQLASDPGELRPDDERNRAGRQTYIWNVDGMKGLEQVCEYAGTLVRLVRPVPGPVKRCVVEINSAAKGAITARCD